MFQRTSDKCPAEEDCVYLCLLTNCCGRTVELWWYKMWVQRWSGNLGRGGGGVGGEYGVLIHYSLMDRKQEDNIKVFWLLVFYFKKNGYLSVFVFIFIRLLIGTSWEVITLSGVHPTYNHNNTLIQTYSCKRPRNNNQSPFDKQYWTINMGKCFNTIPISHPFCHIFYLKEGGYYKHILLPKQNHCHTE